ncbi:MAG: class I SAM-dependent methyltransferase [Rhodothermales bacterium]|nr:class I SAM-dependent methyltransferase [Rhodothermales bacterium]
MDACRACQSRNMYLFLRLGAHPPASRVLAAEELTLDESKFPLDVHVCLDCALIQVPDFIPPEFYRHYFYVPSASETMHRHFDDMADMLLSRFASDRSDRIVDIGSNDGLFLKACKDKGGTTLGIEPAANLTEIARSKGIDVVNEYFNPTTARQVRSEYGSARVIVTTNTFNHIDDLHSFMEGITLLLDDEGVFVVEVPQALDLVEKNEFDTIYHEHLSEFSVKSLVDLYAFSDMEVFDIERLEIHGGSMRVFGQKVGASRDVCPVVDEWIQNERNGALFDRATYETFRERVNENKRNTMSMLKRLKQEGRTLAGYGAPSKGNTLLNYYGIDSNYLDFVADRSTLKQGRYTPGSHIPIVAPDKILEVQPDYLLLLAWNFADEILKQQAEYRSRGGKFIVPIPEPHIVD